MTARLAETGDRTPTEVDRARGEAFIVERQEYLEFARAASIMKDVPLTQQDKTEMELTKWALAMGLAGSTIYILQSHTISDIVEMVPIIQ